MADRQSRKTPFPLEILIHLNNKKSFEDQESNIVKHFSYIESIYNNKDILDFLNWAYLYGIKSEEPYEKLVSKRFIDYFESSRRYVGILKELEDKLK